VSDCLLAPVPTVHLPGIQEIADRGGPVALGSDAFDLFERLKRSGAVGALPVYFVASRTGLAGGQTSLFDLNKVHFRGVLADIVPAIRGRHPDPARRPASALETDSGWALFWEASGLERLSPPLALARFATRSGQPWMRVPEGPVEAKFTTG
jgi:hypothetical protein